MINRAERVYVTVHFHFLPRTSLCRGKALWRRIPAGDPRCSSRRPRFRERRLHRVREQDWRSPGHPFLSSVARASRAARVASGRTPVRWSTSRDWRRAAGSSASSGSSAKTRARPVADFPRSCCIFAAGPGRGKSYAEPSILRTSRVNQKVFVVGKKRRGAHAESFYADIVPDESESSSLDIISILDYSLDSHIHSANVLVCKFIACKMHCYDTRCKGGYEFPRYRDFLSMPWAVHWRFTFQKRLDPTLVIYFWFDK